MDSQAPRTDVYDSMKITCIVAPVENHVIKTCPDDACRDTYQHIVEDFVGFYPVEGSSFICYDSGKQHTDADQYTVPHYIYSENCKSYGIWHWHFKHRFNLSLYYFYDNKK